MSAVAPEDLPLHFEENLLGDGEAERHVRRGVDQWTYLGKDHPLATLFPNRVQPAGGSQPSTLLKVKLKDAIAILASVCAKQEAKAKVTRTQIITINQAQSTFFSQYRLSYIDRKLLSRAIQISRLILTNI